MKDFPQPSVHASAKLERTQMINYCCCCSVAKPCSTLCNPMDCGPSGSSFLHYLPKSAQLWLEKQLIIVYPGNRRLQSITNDTVYQRSPWQIFLGEEYYLQKRTGCKMSFIIITNILNIKINIFWCIQFI